MFDVEKSVARLGTLEFLRGARSCGGRGGGMAGEGKRKERNNEVKYLIKESGERLC